MVKNIDEHWMSAALAVATLRVSDPASASIDCLIMRDQKIIVFSNKNLAIQERLISVSNSHLVDDSQYRLLAQAKSEMQIELPLSSHS